MDFSLDSRERSLVQTARDFVREVLIPLEPRVAQATRANSHFPDAATLRDLQSEARARGLWGLQTPVEFGGLGLDALTTALVTIETGKTFVPFDYGGFAPKILFACNAEQRERYLLPTLHGQRHFCLALSEPEAGSDATNLRTTATRCGNDWIINGAKSWISGGHLADFAIVLAVTDKEKRHRGGITAFLVDRERGWTSRATPTMLGEFHQSCFNEPPPAELTFEDVRVPGDCVLGEVGQGFQLALSSVGGGGRLRIPAYSIGHALRLIDIATEHIRSLGDTSNSAVGPSLEALLADCAADLEAAKWLVLHAAWKFDRSGTRYEVSMAKHIGSNMIWRVIDRVVQILGPAALSKEMHIERLLRQARVYRIFAGSDEIMMKGIAQALRNDPSLVHES